MSIVGNFVVFFMVLNYVIALYQNGIGCVFSRVVSMAYISIRKFKI